MKKFLAIFILSLFFFSPSNASNSKTEIYEWICAQKIHMQMDSYDYKLSHHIDSSIFNDLESRNIAKKIKKKRLKCRVLFSQKDDMDNFNKLAFFMKSASQNRDLFMDRYINEEQLQTLMSTSLYDLKLNDGKIKMQTDNFDNDTLNKLLSAAKDFKDGKISEEQFDNIKDEILKSL